MTYRRRIVALTGAAGLVLSTSTALAQTTTVACNDTTVLPNPIFMAGSSAFEPISANSLCRSRRSRMYQSSMTRFPRASACPRFRLQSTIPSAAADWHRHYYTVDPTDSTKTVTIPASLGHHHGKRWHFRCRLLLLPRH